SRVRTSSGAIFFPAATLLIARMIIPAIRRFQPHFRQRARFSFAIVIIYLPAVAGGNSGLLTLKRAD
ncbi:hypothetical protein, partial [Klebsiella sp. X1-16S-Nf21]|uniref:hypothetical protein n=1 Tax=Klebsiella sp. X1-16S-Nf21 TaxID=2057804 RepID=UPI0019805195